MLNKPSGIITATKDKENKTVLDLFPDEERKFLHAAGRLDRDTEGLLIITDDGDLTFRLTRPEFGFIKRYFFMAFGELSKADIEKVESGGIPFGDGSFSRPAEFSDIALSTVLENTEYIPEDIREHALKNPSGKITSGIIAVSEGKHHEVKLLLHSCGCKIFRLKRLSVGDIFLDKKLKGGEYRLFTPEETALAEEYKKRYIPNINIKDAPTEK